MLGPVRPYFPWLRKLWVHGGYSGADFADWVRQHRPKLAVEVIQRTDDLAGFRGVPKRWVVERTLAWLTRQRRLVRDYERSAASATAWIYVALIRIMLRHLA